MALRRVWAAQWCDVEVAARLVQLNKAWNADISQWRSVQSQAALQLAGNAALRTVAQHCPRLSCLDISGCRDITTDAVLAAIKHLPLLRRLTVTDCLALHRPREPDCCCCRPKCGIEVLREQRSNLEVICSSITLHVKGLHDMTFVIKEHTPLRSLMLAYCRRCGLDPSQLYRVRFMVDGDLIQPSDTPSTLKLEDGDYLEAAHMDIGEWVETYAGVAPLSGPEALLLGLMAPDGLSGVEVAAIEQQLGRASVQPLSNTAAVASRQVLAPRQCAVLVQFVERAFVSGGSADFDLKLEVSPGELDGLLGSGAVRALVACAKAVLGKQEAAVKQVVLRRRAVREDKQECIPFHRDFSVAVVSVALNSDFKGGHLYFAMHGRIVCPYRPIGCATAHNDAVVHGVSRLESGVRYVLLLAFHADAPTH
eukprot:CAMPEP_0171068776 /NCGR_PEP_ID=MMETSP0766_2-20121228/8766_1 /TAXON_ID=439317 /ORGANISM="Gambierdiscus australes, Strain CAWD 149" /LENGTH=422 /DNA_ID=CAMNT_0011525125 /DNA_START=26 /DNA_END=1294 /DNA_ORIENTATION=-